MNLGSCARLCLALSVGLTITLVFPPSLAIANNMTSPPPDNLVTPLNPSNGEPLSNDQIDWKILGFQQPETTDDSGDIIVFPSNGIEVATRITKDEASFFEFGFEAGYSFAISNKDMPQQTYDAVLARMKQVSTSNDKEIQAQYIGFLLGIKEGLLVQDTMQAFGIQSIKSTKNVSPPA